MIVSVFIASFSERKFNKSSKAWRFFEIDTKTEWNEWTNPSSNSYLPAQFNLKENSLDLLKSLSTADRFEMNLH